MEKALDDVPIRTSATRRGKLFKRLIPVRPGQDYPSPPTRRTKIPALLRMSKNGIAVRFQNISATSRSIEQIFDQSQRLWDSLGQLVSTAVLFIYDRF